MNEKYEKLKKLGEGGFGTTYKAINKQTDEIVAIKVIKIRNYQYFKDAEKEIKYLRILDCHPHVSCYYDSSYYDNNIIIEMQYIDGYTLDQYINFFEKPYDLCLQIIEIINNTLIYIHSKDILHLDLKPNNILVDKKGILKIIDYDISCIKKLYDSCDEPCCVRNPAGTEFFMAPETYYDDVNFKSTDIWLMGATIYYLVTKKYIRTQKQIDNNIYDKVFKLNTQNELLDLIVNSCLQINHLHRITSKEIDKLLKYYK